MNKIAVYGTLRQGCSNHALLEDSKLLSRERTDDQWEMFSLTGFPGIRKGNKAITIEVYEVTDDVAKTIDRLEGYRGTNKDNWYNKVQIDTSQGKVDIYTLERPEYDNYPIIPSGDWAQFRYAQ